MPNVDDILVGAVTGLGLKRIAKRVLPYAPRWVRRLSEQRIVRTRRRLVCEQVLEDRYREAVELLKSNGVELGDYLEFGVYNGTSLLCMFRTLQQIHESRVRLFGFDSFEGLPAIAKTDCGGHWRPGEFKSSYDFTKMVLDHEGVDWNRVTLVKGFYDQTLTEDLKRQHGIKKVSIIMMDCDLYQSTKEALRFCETLIQDQCVIFFDDWFPLAERNMGEKLAFDEFLAAHQEFEARELGDFEPRGKVYLVSRKGCL